MIEQEVYIIIVNWNRADLTIDCLRSLDDKMKIKFRITLVDNHSDDSDFVRLTEWLKNNQWSFIVSDEQQIEDVVSPGMIIIRCRENLGFAKANNIALKHAAINHYRYAYLLNNDTVSEPDSLYLLHDFLQHHADYVAVVPQIRYFNNQRLVWNCGGKLIHGFHEQYYYHNVDISTIRSTAPIDITLVTGCALLLDISRINYLTEMFFFGEEDIDLSRRIRAMKLKMKCILQAVVYHKVSSSIDQTAAHINKLYIHKLNRAIHIKNALGFRGIGVLLIRILKFFFWCLFIIKMGLKKSILVSSCFIKDVFFLHEVNKNTFTRLIQKVYN